MTDSAQALRFPGGGRVEVTASQARWLESFVGELVRRDPGGASLARVADPELLAQLTADRVVDAAAAWQEHLGPLYDAESVGRLLAYGGRPISRQAVSKRRNLLALRTGSGRVVYPAFQFAAGSVVPGLAEVLDAVPDSAVSRWTLASWLVSPAAGLDGSTPVEALRRNESARVVELARQWAAALAA
ncbi:MAG: hypothetical protein EPO13_00410 [Actinomycetota bacterium]|nr:MAG: hypothetical protein EPO13_00410 [Actinomycetota bacterium]